MHVYEIAKFNAFPSYPLYSIESTYTNSTATDQSSGSSPEVSNTSADNRFRGSGVYQMHQHNQIDLKDRKRYLEYGW